MNATDFIKHCGLNTAIRIIEDSKNDDFWDTETAFYTDKNSESCVCLSELKHLVESVDLIDSLGGLELSKKESNNCRFYEYADMSHRAYAIKQAIADYEQLFGNTETSELETLRNCDTSPNCKKFNERVK